MGREALDQPLGDDAADPDGEAERQGRQRDAEREPHRVRREAVREVPGEEAEHRIDEGGGWPLDGLVADMATELRQVERARPGTPRLPEEGHVVEHALVPARVLADHSLGRLRQVHQLEQRERPNQDSARAEGVAERGVFRRAGDREEPDGLERVEAHKLVVAEADLRAPEAELEDGPRQPREPRRPRLEPREPRDASALVDEPRDRDAGEDGRLLDGAHAPARPEAVDVGEGERHALVGATVAALGPAARQDVRGDPAIGVRVGDRVGVAHADPDPRGVGVAVEERL